MLVVVLVGVIVMAVHRQHFDPKHNGRRLSEWVRMLYSFEADEAFNNIRQMGAKAHPGLISMLAAEDSTVLMTLDDWIPFHLIDDHAFLRRKRALHACELLGRDFDPSVAEVQPLLASSDERVRGFGAQLLSRNGKAASGAIPDLLKHLNDPSPWVRGQSAIALGCIGESPDAVVPRLVELLDDTAESLEPTAYSIRPPTVRRMAIIALGGFKERAASSAARLVELFKEHPLERPYIAQTIKVIAPQRIGDLLPTLCEQIQSKDEIQRAAAANAIQILGEFAKPAVPAMIKAMSLYQTNRANILRALSQVDQTKADEFLTEIVGMLGSPNISLQSEAIDLLFYAENDSHAMVSIVQRLANSPDPAVRFNATMWLQRLETTQAKSTNYAPKAR